MVRSRLELRGDRSSRIANRIFCDSFRGRTLKTTSYFDATRNRPDRLSIKDEWLTYAIENPERIQIQTDGRIRLWARIAQAEGKYLRVVLLPDHETIHNAFFDRRFKP